MADAASWVGNITTVTRDDLKVELGNRLAGGGTIIEAKIEAVGGGREL